MSDHQGYGGRAGAGGHGLPVPIEPLHRPGRDAFSQWQKAQEHRARFGIDPDEARRGAKAKKDEQFSLTAPKRRRRKATTDDDCEDVIA